MKIKKFFTSTMILTMLIVIFAFPLQQTMAKKNITFIDVSKKSQIPNGKKQCWEYYNNKQPFIIDGKYHSIVENYLTKKIKETYKLEWIPPVHTESKKKIKQYTDAIKYLSMIVSDIREQTDYIMNHYSSYFDEIGVNKDAQKALVVGDYAFRHMAYGTDYKITGLLDYEYIYKNKYVGKCQASSSALIDICKALGYKTKLFSCEDAQISTGEGHAWMCIAAVNIDGTKYWQGINGSSESFSLVWNAPDRLRYQSDYNDYYYLPQHIDDVNAYDPSEPGFDFGKKIFGDKLDGESCIYTKVGDVFEIPCTYGDIVEGEEDGLKVEKTDDIWRITILDVFEHSEDFDESGEEEGSLIVPISIKMPVFYDEEIDPEDDVNGYLYDGITGVFLPLTEWDFIVRKS